MNRYYRPSAPRYTSQFVEDQYPMDLILQAGAMKYRNKQKMASDVAEFSAMANILPAGNRTQEMAPVVRGNWDKRINDTISKYSSNYDSPQAMMEFTRLKQEWQIDPDVQLMKYDYELGNKEWDEIRKSPTYALDKKGSNINPSTGMLKQFRSGDQYTPYAPVTKYADYGARAIDEYKTIELQSKYVKDRKPYVDEFGNTGMEEVQGEVQYRDLKMLQGKTLSLAQNVINRSTQEGAYLYADLTEKLGRAPTIEDAMKVYKPYEASAVAYKENFQTNWNENTGSGSGNGSGKPGSGGQSVGLPVGDDNYTNVNVSKLKSLRTLNTFASGNVDVSNISQYKNQLAKLERENPGLSKADNRTKINALIDDTKKQQFNKSNFNYKTFNPDEQNTANQTFISRNIINGVLTEDASSPFLEGQVMIDQQTGEIVQDESKADYLKKGNYVNIIGTVDDKDIARSPMPGGLILQTGTGKKARTFILKGPEEYSRANKRNWNLHSYLRAKDSDIGDGSIMQIGIDTEDQPIVQYLDGSDPGMNFNEDNLAGTGSNELFIKPLKDNTDSGKIKVKVFAFNPSMAADESTSNRYNAIGKIEAVRNQMPGRSPLGNVLDVAESALMYNQNDGILDNSNEFFLGEYELGGKSKDGKRVFNNMLDIEAEILNDRKILLGKKATILNSMKQK